MADDVQARIVWAPQPGPQTAFISCPVFEVFFGGSRGGGKTDAVLGEWVAHAAQYGQDAIGIMLRRTREQLTETIERSRILYTPLGAQYHTQDKMWRFPNGARLRFAYLERDADADNYQGHSYTRVYIEEIGTFPDPAPIRKMMATLRSGMGVPCGFRATGNPGGPGHTWIKARYIDPAPSGWKPLWESFRDPVTDREVRRDRIYIPSRLHQNRFLGAEYVANLQMSGSPELVRAWLEGDWTVIAGAYFPEFSMDRHVVKPFAIPEHWMRFRAFDWGSAAPFSVGWYAVSDGSLLPDGRQFPTGALIKYREWYGASEPNVGLKMTVEDVAKGIKAREADDRIAYGVADPACGRSDGGPSMLERMMREGVTFRSADNNRLAGWDQVRQRLKGEDDRPLLYFFETCVDTIRTLPVLQHDSSRPEDVDSDGEDHAGDETRYACMSRPYVRKAPEVEKPRWGTDLTINELIASNRRARMRDD